MRNTISMVLFVMLIGCKPKDGGTATGNPGVSFAVTGSPQAATVAMLKKEAHHFLLSLYELFTPKAFGLPAPSGMVDASGKSIVLGQFWVTLSDVEFKSQEIPDINETNGSDVQFAGPYTINILSSSPSDLDTKAISATEIRRIKFKIARSKNLTGAAPIELSDQSIFISGTVNGIAFSFKTQQEVQYEIAGPNPVVAKDQSLLLLEIKTASLFKKINLSSITSTTVINESNKIPGTSPCPSIDSAAADLYTCFYKGLSTEANFGRDENHDFDLGGSDDTVK